MKLRDDVAVVSSPQPAAGLPDRRPRRFMYWRPVEYNSASSLFTRRASNGQGVRERCLRLADCCRLAVAPAPARSSSGGLRLLDDAGKAAKHQAESKRILARGRRARRRKEGQEQGRQGPEVAAERGKRAVTENNPRPPAGYEPCEECGPRWTRSSATASTAPLVAETRQPLLALFAAMTGKRANRLSAPKRKGAGEQPGGRGRLLRAAADRRRARRHRRSRRLRRRQRQRRLLQALRAQEANAAVVDTGSGVTATTAGAKGKEKKQTKAEERRAKARSPKPTTATSTK